jgi:hypothetical protein
MKKERPLKRINEKNRNIQQLKKQIGLNFNKFFRPVQEIGLTGLFFDPSLEEAVHILVHNLKLM